MGTIQYNLIEGKEYNFQQLSNELTRATGFTNTVLSVFHPDNLALSSDQKQKFQDIIDSHDAQSPDRVRVEMTELLDCVTTAEATAIIGNDNVMGFLGGISVGGNVYSISVNVFNHWLAIMSANSVVITQGSQTALINKLKSKGLVFPT